MESGHMGAPTCEQTDTWPARDFIGSTVKMVIFNIRLNDVELSRPNKSKNKGCVGLNHESGIQLMTSKIKPQEIKIRN